MVAWAAVGAIAGVISAAVSVTEHLQQDKVSNTDLKAQIEALSRQLESVRQEILGALRASERRELEGEADGLILTFRTYDPVKPDQERLRELIDDGAKLLGRLLQLLAALEPIRNPNDYFPIVDAYLTMVLLRGISMWERERVFHVPEVKDIPLMYGPSLAELDRALNALKILTNNRVVGPVSERNGSDSIDYGYLLDGAFQLVDSIIDEPIQRGIHQSPGKALEEARQAIAKKRVELFDLSTRRADYERLIAFFTK